MKSVHHYAMQQRRSQRPSVQAELADTLHQLQRIHLMKTHGQQRHPLRQQVVDGEPPQLMSHRSKSI
jgi:hypothetical protein